LSGITQEMLDEVKWVGEHPISYDRVDPAVGWTPEEQMKFNGIVWEDLKKVIEFVQAMNQTLMEHIEWMQTHMIDLERL
jgi:hypothetical protein